MRVMAQFHERTLGLDECRNSNPVARVVVELDEIWHFLSGLTISPCYPPLGVGMDRSISPNESILTKQNRPHRVCCLVYSAGI